MKALIFCSGMLLLPFLAGCSKSTDTGNTTEDEYREYVSPVDNVSVTSKTGSSISFLAVAQGWSSCSKFSRAAVSKKDSVYSITIYGKEPKNAACLGVLTSIDAPLTIIVPSPGTYQFKFWQSDGTSKDTTIFIQ